MNLSRSQNTGIGSAVTGAGSSVWSFFSSNLFYGVLTLVFLVAIYLYWHYIGYEVTASYKTLVDMITQKKEGSVGLDLTGSGTPTVGATAMLPTSNQEQEGKQGPIILPPGEEQADGSIKPTLAHPNPSLRPSQLPGGIPGATEGHSGSAYSIRNSLFPQRGEVFNVSRNIYTYDEAVPVCRALGAELATFEQVQEAHKSGADWCNYGWVKGQMAVYPTQKETWDKLQTGPTAYKQACGKPGVNGGFFDNPELRFGVNCFGVRPDKKSTDELLSESGAALPPTPEEIDFDRKVQKFRDQMDTLIVLPWNKSNWSS